MVNGWMAPSLGNTMAPADTPLDIVFSTRDWAAETGEALAPRTSSGVLEKVSADG